MLLSSAASCAMKAGSRWWARTAALRGEGSGSARASSKILKISLWRRLFIVNCFMRATRVGKKFWWAPTMSREFSTFSFSTKRRIYTILRRPVPSFARPDTCSFSTLFSMKCCRSWVKSATTCASSGSTKGTLVR